MSEPTFEIGSWVEVNINWRTSYPPVWEKAIVQSVSNLFANGELYPEPVYQTSKGTYSESAMRPIQEEQ